MKNFKVLFVIIITFIFYQGTICAADLQDGIFGLKWGKNLSNLNNFSKLWSSSNVDFYIKPGEALTINNVIIPEVIYGFYSDQFFAVYVKIDTIEVFYDFRRYMKSKYGNPEKTWWLKTNLTVYRWRFKDIKIKLKLNEKNNNMKLAFYYAPLSSKVNEAQQEKFQSESFKFFPIDKDKTPEHIPFLQF
jgi:hypothetical protein